MNDVDISCCSNSLDLRNKREKDRLFDQMAKSGKDGIADLKVAPSEAQIQRIQRRLALENGAGKERGHWHSASD